MQCLFTVAWIRPSEAHRTEGGGIETAEPEDAAARGGTVPGHHKSDRLLGALCCSSKPSVLRMQFAS